MGKIMMNGIQYGVGGIEQAKDISYDNTESGATATDVQGALDELNAGLFLSSNTALVSSISANTATSVVKIENVPKGYYVVSSSVRFSTTGTSGIIYARINGSNRNVASLYATDQYADYTSVINVTSDNATVDIMLQISSARSLLAAELNLLKV